MNSTAESHPRQSKDPFNWFGWLFGFVFVFICSGLAGASPTPPSDRQVYVVNIEGMIDLGLAPYVRRIVQEAEQKGAAAVVLDINTFGGRVDAAVQIRDTLARPQTERIQAPCEPRPLRTGAAY